MNIYTILAFILGIIIAYTIFYFRYKHKDTIDQLRSNFKEANKEVHNLNQEIEEYIQQNNLLKNKMGDFLEKNDDLSKVVGELSKYYYHIKKASKKTEELTKYLQEPDPEIEEKMQNYLVSMGIESENKQEKTKTEDFF